MIRDYWDLIIFVDTDFKVTLSRAINRNQEKIEDLQELKQRYKQRYIPGQQLYFTNCQLKSRADIIIDNNDYTCPILHFKRKQS